MVDMVHSGLTASIPGGDEVSGAGRVAAVLNAAADLLEKPGGWTQGALALGGEGEYLDVDSSDATCFCVVGAIRRVSGFGRRPEETIPVRQALAASLRLPGYKAPLVNWNDDPDRTQAEVVKALRHAALTVTPQVGAPA